MLCIRCIFTPFLQYCAPELLYCYNGKQQFNADCKCYYSLQFNMCHTYLKTEFYFCKKQQTVLYFAHVFLVLYKYHSDHKCNEQIIFVYTCA